MPPPALIRQRLNAQYLSRPLAADPARLVSALGALQAQDFSMALWAVGLRTGANRTAVLSALNTGDIIRTHILRPTWHLVAAADLRWMLALSGPRVLRVIAPYARQFGLTEADFKKARAVFEKALPGKALTREALQPLLEKAGVPTTDFRMTQLLMRAELEGQICSGPRSDHRGTYMLLDERVPAAKLPFEGDAAAAELARRYFSTRGPATAADFAWWSGFTQRQAQAALSSIRSELDACGNDRYRIITDGAIGAVGHMNTKKGPFDAVLFNRYEVRVDDADGSKIVHPGETRAAKAQATNQNM
ncbi:MAG: winged helix DNA-binding domain-containing protein, partial [Sphingobacteriales bacterium]